MNKPKTPTQYGAIPKTTNINEDLSKNRTKAENLDLDQDEDEANNSK